MTTESAKTSTIMTHKNRMMLLVVGVLLIAANLRAPVTRIAPMIELISGSFQLSATQAGLLTTLPLIAFALFAPPSAYCSKTFWCRIYDLFRTGFYCHRFDFTFTW